MFLCLSGNHIDLSESVPNPGNVEKCLNEREPGGEGTAPRRREVKGRCHGGLCGCGVGGAHLLTTAPGEGNTNQQNE